MTKAEYNSLYAKSRKIHNIQYLKTKKKILAIYREAGKQVSEAVRNAEKRGLSELTTASQINIEESLTLASRQVAQSIEKEIPLLISRSYKLSYAKIDEKYIVDVIKDVPGAEEIFTEVGIHNMFVQVDRRMIESLATRIYQDGYTLSARIWNNLIISKKGNFIPGGIYGDVQYRLKNVISAGLAQGRDLIKIAKDITTYIDDGKVQLLKRYGRLERGTSEFTKRISGTIDWRAVRLVKSELYASLQDAGLRNGEYNPACTGLYNFIKTAGNPIDPDGSRNASGKRCIDIQAANPHKPEDLNFYNHTSCQCQKRPVLMNRNDFVSELKDWVSNQGSSRRLTDFYYSKYIPAQV